MRVTFSLGASALALAVLLCAAPADATIALAQAPVCTVGVAAVSLGSAPANGSVVVGVEASVTAGSTLSDSNSVSYTVRVSANGNSTTWGYLWDGSVTGSPTATYTFGNAAGLHCLYNLSGAATPPGVYGFNGVAAGSTSLTTGALGGSSVTGDISITTGVNINNASSLTLSGNVGTNTADATVGSTYYATHATATSNGNPTATLFFTTGDAAIAAAYYTSSGSGGSELLKFVPPMLRASLPLHAYLWFAA